MRFRAPLLLACLALAGAPARAAAPERGGEDLIARVLVAAAAPGGTTVLRPETRLGMVRMDSPGDRARSLEYCKKNLQVPGYDASALIDALFEHNAAPVRLRLPSAPQDGYVVDHDGTYAAYFKTGGGGWEKLRRDHPGAGGMATVSIPVVDREQRLLLIYLGTQYDWLAGSGHLVVFRMEGAKLREVASLMLWIS
ncbi:hypothetical protein [Geothrix paludis]|uniref:hypothetical protein n=1 Tax=Geothrix paludis TaxID=2922722 RepID=UPI001FAC6499|nr:hypothetical protein [Geothrix paludis]